MKQLFLLCLPALMLFNTSMAQDDGGSPYRTSFKTDGPLVLGGIAATGLGVYLIQNKKDLTDAELAKKTKSNVWFFDRASAGFYDEKLDDASYAPFHFSFAFPVAMALLNKNERNKIGQVAVLYLETMGITGGLFTIAAGSVQRSRPFVYDDEDPSTPLRPKDERIEGNNQRSFYAGHTASSAAACFFAAKVFSDFNPDSKLKPVIWVVAAAVPAAVGYMRYKAGMHFLSDNILGYVIGAGTGILVPALHKKDRMKNLSFVPQVGVGYKGVALAYRF